MISEVDENMSGSIDFAEFLKVIENQKERAENFDDENDMIDAFVACGGRPDKAGHVKRETLGAPPPPRGPITRNQPSWTLWRFISASPPSRLPASSPPPPELLSLPPPSPGACTSQ
mmetsp:Transcript_37379/g.101211  ORF Transcript_37379/g.101211 Transcript_37379/m.101211 type:complete len:116 (-) Transcript_37379:183-530(-)